MTFITEITYDRVLSATERATRRAYIADLIATGVTDGIVTTPADRPHVGQRTWSTLEAANNWITYCNTFTPAPIYTAVTEV